LFFPSLLGMRLGMEVIRRGCQEDLSAEELLARITQEVKAFSGEGTQGDDQTAVVLKVLGTIPITPRVS
jgi:serine phosphatase RsbU (regulator of sigma subunit)